VRYDESAESGVYAVRTRFSLACGDAFLGYSTPIGGKLAPDEHMLGFFAPAIVTDNGHVPFWHVVEAEPAPDSCKAAYRRLGRSADEVFPVKWRTDVASVEGVYYDGQVDAFHFLVYDGGEFRLVFRS
jgi:hypothetical protein